MTILMVLLLVAALLSIPALHAAFRDGHGPHRPPTSRFEDPRFSAPGRR